MSGIAITFPGSPAEGQSYLAQNGFTYIYDSQKNRWKRGGDFVRAPKVLSYAGVAVTTTGSGITTGPNGALIYEIPGVVIPNSTAGIDSYKAYRYTDSYPNYTEIQVSISSAFSSVAYAATSTSTTFTIPGATLSGNTTYYLRARQFVGSNASIASTGEISGYSPNVVRFITTSVYLDSPTIVSIAGTTGFPVYQIGFAGTTLPATVTYTGSGVGNLDKVEWRVTGPRNPDSTGDTALAEVGIGTFSSATLANSLVLAMPFSGAAGVGITNDVNNAIRSASGASAGTTKTVTAVGSATTVSVGIATTTAHFYPSAAYFNGSATNDHISIPGVSLGENTEDFTFETWLYTNDTVWMLYGGSTSAALGIGYNVDNSGQGLGVWSQGVAPDTTSGVQITYNTWNHIAVCRKSSIISFFVNGVRVYSANNSVNYPTNSTAYIGRDRGTTAGFYYIGYIQDLKIYKGLAKYKENFTPPLPTYGTISYTTSTIGSVGIATTAFLKSTGDIPTAEVAIGSSTAAQVASSLVLAMPLNKTFGFQDINVAVRGLTSGASAGTAKTVGLGTTSTANAPTHPFISATESKWYDGAAYFDGPINTVTSGIDYLSTPNTTDFDMPGDFTWECWAYPLQLPASDAWPTNWWQHSILFGRGTPSVGDGWGLIIGGTKLIIQSSDSQIVSGTHNISVNNWYHLSATRSGSTVRIFVNGVLVGSATNSSSFGGGSNFYIGAETGEGGAFVGYIQDLKIYKGFAKYTANFTPPRPICGFTTDLAIQTGFTTTTASGALLSSVVGLGSTSTLAFGADQTYSGITSITSSSGITTLPDTYAQNLVLALPLANITGVGNSFTNDRNTQIRSVSLVGGGVTAGTTKTITNTGGVGLASTSKWYNNSASFSSGRWLNFDYAQSWTSDFTIEGWAYKTSTGTNKTIYDFTNGQDNYGLFASINTSDVLTANFYSTTSGASIFGQLTGTTTPLNTWFHWAVVRQGTSYRLYQDGVLTSSSISASSPVSTNYHNIGERSDDVSGVQPFIGYMQDFRVYVGTAKYTTNFTPPPPMFGDYTRSTPNKIVFTPGSDYVLEARNTASGGIVTTSYSASRQWGTKPEGGIYDPYGANLVLAIPGGAVGGATTTFDVTGQIRFETPTATYVNAGIVTYSNSLGIGTYGNKSVTNTGPVSISSTITKYYSRSMQFNGTTAYLEAASSSDFAFGTDDFTFEFWYYYVSGVDRGIFANNSGASVGINFLVSAGAGGPFRVYNGTNANNLFDFGVSPTPNIWEHIALVRKNGLLSLFVNGILRTTVNWTGVNAGNTATFSVGAAYGNARFTFGYITDFRAYKNLAKYTSNFTPPNQIYLT